MLVSYKTSVSDNAYYLLVIISQTRNHGEKSSSSILFNPKKKNYVLGTLLPHTVNYENWTLFFVASKLKSLSTITINLPSGSYKFGLYSGFILNCISLYCF